jgi:hypothetical protein
MNVAHGRAGLKMPFNLRLHPGIVLLDFGVPAVTAVIRNDRISEDPRNDRKQPNVAAHPDELTGSSRGRTRG